MSEVNRTVIRGLSDGELKNLRIRAARAGYTSLNAYLLAVLRQVIRGPA